MNLRKDLLSLMKVMNLMGGGQKKMAGFYLNLKTLLLCIALFFMLTGKRLIIISHVWTLLVIRIIKLTILKVILLFTRQPNQVIRLMAGSMKNNLVPKQRVLNRVQRDL